MQSTILLAVVIVVLIIVQVSISNTQKDPDLIDIPKSLSKLERKKEIVAVKKLMHDHAADKVERAEKSVMEKLEKIQIYMETKERVILEGVVEKSKDVEIVKQKIGDAVDSLVRLEKEETEHKLQLKNQARAKNEEAEEMRKQAEKARLEAEEMATAAEQRITDMRAAAIRKLQEKRTEQAKLREKAEAEEAAKRLETVRAKRKEREALLLAQQKIATDSTLKQEQLQEERRIELQVASAEIEEKRLAAIEEAKNIQRQAEQRAIEIAENIREEELRISQEMEDARQEQIEAEAMEADRMAEEMQKVKDAELEAAQLKAEAESRQREMEAEEAEFLLEKKEEIAMQKEEQRILQEEAEEEDEEMEREQAELEEELRLETEELERLRQEEIQAEKDEYDANQQLREEEEQERVRQSEEDGQAAADDLVAQTEQQQALQDAQAAADLDATESAQADSDAAAAESAQAQSDAAAAAPVEQAPPMFRYFCIQKPPELIPFWKMTDDQIKEMYSHATHEDLKSEKSKGYGNPDRMIHLRKLATYEPTEDSPNGSRDMFLLQPRITINSRMDEEGYACEGDEDGCTLKTHKFPVNMALVAPGQSPTINNITVDGQPKTSAGGWAETPSIETIDTDGVGQFKYVWTFAKQVMDISRSYYESNDTEFEGVSGIAAAASGLGLERYQLPPARSKLGKMVDSIFPKTEHFMDDFMVVAMTWATDPKEAWRNTLIELGIKDEDVLPDGSYTRVPVDKTFCDNLDGFTWKGGICEHDTLQDSESEKLGKCTEKGGHLYTLTVDMTGIDPNLPMEEQIKLANARAAEKSRLKYVKDFQKKMEESKMKQMQRVIEREKAKQAALDSLRKDCKYQYSSTIKSGLGAWTKATTPTFKETLIPGTTKEGKIEYKVFREITERAKHRKADQQAMKKYVTFAGPQACTPCDPYTKEWLNIIEEPTDPGKSSCPTETVKKVPCEPFMSCQEYTAKINAKTRARHDAIDAMVDANKQEVKKLVGFAREESRARKRYEARVKTISSVTTKAGKERYDKNVADTKVAWDKARKDYNIEAEKIFKGMLAEANNIPREIFYCKSRWLFGPSRPHVGITRVERKDSISKKYFGNNLPYDFTIKQTKWPLAPDLYGIMLSRGENATGNPGMYAGAFKSINLPNHIKQGTFGASGTFSIRNVGGVDESKINGAQKYEYRSTPWKKDGKEAHNNYEQRFVVYDGNTSQTYILKKTRQRGRWVENKILVKDGLYKLEAGGKLSLIHKQKARKESHDGTSYQQKNTRTLDNCAYKRRMYVGRDKNNKPKYEEKCRKGYKYNRVNDTTKPIKDYTYYNRTGADSTEELYNFNNTKHGYALVANFGANDIWLVSTSGWYYSVANNRKMRIDSSQFCSVTEPVIANALGGINSIGKYGADCFAEDSPKEGCGDMYKMLSQISRAKDENNSKYEYENNLLLNNFNHIKIKQAANDHYKSYA